MKHPRLFALMSASLVVVVAGGVLLYNRAQDPTRVFNDMLTNNLSTSGVTRLVTQKGSSLSVDQYTQLNLGEKPSAHALTTFKQGGGSIVTEEISDKKSDYVQYRQIVSTHKNAAGKPINTASVVGKWAKLDSTDTLSSSVTSGLFDQSILGVLPIANLDTTSRVQLLNSIKQNGTFSFDVSKVTVGHLNGRKVLQYPVIVKPAAYVALMQQFGKLVGANEYASLNPSDYAGARTLSLQVSVDASSHELAQIYQTASKHNEQYLGFGIPTPTSLPHATLTTAELEKRITALQ